MSVVLIFSERCPYCLEILNFIREHPVLIPMIKTHEISRQGVPDGVQRVPTLMNSRGETYVGIEVLRWLENRIPTTFEGLCQVDGMACPFDEPFDEIGDGFPLDSYGISLSPHITKELQQKIDKSVGEAYAEVKKNVQN